MTDDQSDISTTNEFLPFFSALKGKKSRFKPERNLLFALEPPASPDVFSRNRDTNNSDDSNNSVSDEKLDFSGVDFSDFNKSETEDVSKSKNGLLDTSFLLDFGDLKLSEPSVLDTISEEVTNGNQEVNESSVNLKSFEISTQNPINANYVLIRSPEDQKHSVTRNVSNNQSFEPQKTGSIQNSILNTIKYQALEHKTPLKDEKYDTTNLLRAIIPNDSILLLQEKLHPTEKSTKPFTTPARKFSSTVAPFRATKFPKTMLKSRQDLNSKFETNCSNKENQSKQIDQMKKSIISDQGVNNYQTILRHNQNSINIEPVFKTPQIKTQIPMIPTSVSVKKTTATLYEGTFRILDRNYLIQRKLGQGGSCEVFEAVDMENSNIYAIKCVNLAVDQPLANEFLSEINTLAKLQSTDYVIKMFASEQIDDKLYVVMEKGEMDLSQLIEKQSNLHMAMIIYYWIEMLNAVKCIHDNGVIHSDLKPANFLLVNGRLKLIDFGIASVVQGDSTSIIKNTQAGTISYISPEALMDTRDFSLGSPTSNNVKINISYKSDVWSLGCILYKFIYSKTPFHYITNRWAKISTIMDKNHKIDFPERDDIPPKVMQTLKNCLIFEMRKRPSVAELLKIKYICYNNCD